MIATWDDSSDDSSSDEEQPQEKANFALMAIGDQSDNESEEESHNEVKSKPSYDELYNAFFEMCDEIENNIRKHSRVKKELKLANTKNNELLKQVDALKVEVDCLKKRKMILCMKTPKCKRKRKKYVM